MPVPDVLEERKALSLSSAIGALGLFCTKGAQKRAILFRGIAPYFINTFILGSTHRAVRTHAFYFVKFNNLKIIHVSSAALTFIFFLVLLFNLCEQFVSPLNRLSVNLVPLVPRGTACPYSYYPTRDGLLKSYSPKLTKCLSRRSPHVKPSTDQCADVRQRL